MIKMEKKERSKDSKNPYFENYDDEKRWMSYWYQIKNILELSPKSVLEIGPGNKTVARYLEDYGLEVTTVAIDREIDPDFVCDVRDLSEKVNQNSFDVVLCAEVLEHIPFQDFEKALSELHRVSKKYAVLSLPHSSLNLKFSCELSPFKERRLLMKFPITRLMEQDRDGAHYWSIGKKNYSLSKIKEKIESFFKIKKTYCPYYQPYHRFFKLKVK